MIKKTLTLLSFLFVLGLVFFYFFQEKFIFLHGKKLERNYQFKFENPFEEVFIKTKDNHEINALHFKLEKPKGVILFCHGNKGNLTKWGKRVAYFLKYNFEVFVFDYRNYGKSKGNFNEKEMYSDAILAYNFIKQNFKEEQIVVYGFSLGSTFATKIASESNPKELILEAPFFNLKKALKFYTKLAPTFLLKYKFRTDYLIKKVSSPITIFHGNEDKTTSFKQSKELLQQNRNLKNQFVEINKATHHNIRDFKLYQQKLKEILER